MTKIFSSGKAPILLFIAVALGLGLRLYGIKWGLPDAAHPGYSYHPDEMLHLAWARMMAHGEIIGRHFLYGGTFYYTLLNAYFYFGDRLGDLLGGVNHLANSILLGRYFHTAVAILTILVVYECGRAFFGKTAGALAAIVLAVAPAHILCAQRMRPDEIAAFFAALMILLSWWMMNAPEEKKLRFYVFAGLALGAAIALRFPLVTMIGAPIAAHVFACKGKGALEIPRFFLDRRLATMLGAVALGYIVASPHVLIYPEAFMQGMRIQWNYQSSPFADAVGAGPGIYQYGWTMLHEALGYPIYFLALGGVVLALVRRSKADLIILAAGVPYFVLTTFTSWVVVRYTLPLLPLIAIFAGRFVIDTVERIPRYKPATYAVLIVLVSWTVLADYAYLKMEAEKDVRNVTTEWIQRNLPEGSSILVIRSYSEDYYFNPVVPENYKTSIFFMTEGNDSQSLFRDYRFDYLILHELLYKNMERLGAGHPYPHARVFHESLVNSRYKRIQEFRQPIEAMGIDFSSWFASHDYVIANPEIRVYQYQG